MGALSANSRYYSNMSSNSRLEVSPGVMWERFDVHGIGTGELALLDVLGVTTRPPSGRVAYRIDSTWRWWKEVGHIVIPAPGRVEVWPHPGISPDELAALRGAGAEAFLAPPTEGAWVRRRGVWECAIDVPLS